MNADGSDPEKVTDSRARESCPAWSPDGTTIAFVLDGRGSNNFDIALMDADGTDRRRVTADRATQFGPDWSPDGTRIAYTNYDEFGFTSISTIDADGSDGLVVFDADDRAVSSPVYSPDGLWIVFSRSNLSGDSSNIWVVGSDGEGAAQATSGRPYDVTPGWQPLAS